MGEVQRYAVTVAFISLIIIFCIWVLLTDESLRDYSPLNKSAQEEMNSSNATYKPNIIKRMKCLDCMQLSDPAERQNCMNDCLSYN